MSSIRSCMSVATLASLELCIVVNEMSSVLNPIKKALQIAEGLLYFIAS